MFYLKAAFLGVVQGLTEFLPVSSTGHMILVDEYMKLSPDKAFCDAFMVAIQLPSILAVVVYFWSALWPFVRDREECVARIVLWTKIVVAFLPAAVLGLLLKDFIEEKLFNSVTVAVALAVGGVVLIVLESRKSEATIAVARDITYRTAVAIGFIQCIAMIPGTSRSAATIIGAMTLGASRVAAAEFSFFLAIPTMTGATTLMVLKHGLHFTGTQWTALAVGSAVSFAVSLAVVAWLMRFIRTHSFKPFAYYRIALAIMVLVLLHFFARAQG